MSEAQASLQRAMRRSVLTLQEVQLVFRDLYARLVVERTCAVFWLLALLVVKVFAS